MPTEILDTEGLAGTDKTDRGRAPLALQEHRAAGRQGRQARPLHLARR